MVNRYAEEANEQIRDIVKCDMRRFARICDTPTLARVVDAEPLNKTRMGQYYRECALYRRMRHWDQEEEDLENMRDSVDGTSPYLEMQYEPLAPKYFDLFGHGFRTWEWPQGEPCVSNEKSWKCPKCGCEHRVPANTLPPRCKCGGITPMGEYIRIKAYKR